MFKNKKKINLFILFFFVVFALCPITIWAEAKAKSKVTKRVQSNQTVQGMKNDSSADAAQYSHNDAIDVNENEEKEIKNANEAGLYKNTEGAKSQKRTDPGNDFQRFSEYRADETETQSYGWLIFKTIIIIALLVGGFYYFFRFVTKKAGMPIFGREIGQVLSIVPLGQNKYLQIVDLAGKVLVLGITETNVNFITEITEKEQIDRIRVMGAMHTEKEMPTFRQFVANQVAEFLGKREKRKSSVEMEDDRLEYLIRQKERLKKIRGDINEA